MEINYSLTEEDYLSFNMFHVKNSKTAVRSLNMQRFLGPLFFIIFAWIFSKIAEIPFLGVFIPFLILSVLWFIFYPKYFYHLVSRHTKKMIREGENDGLLGKHHLTMKKEGITETTLNGETKINWSGIKEFKEDEDNFYLYNSAVSAIILPKRGLANPDEVKDYIESRLVV